MKTAHDLVAAAKARVTEVPLDQAEQAIREADVLIDVREADEYAAGHLPGAVNMREIFTFLASSTAEGLAVSLTTKREACSDGMSDIRYPASATLTVGGRTYRGCGRFLTE